MSSSTPSRGIEKTPSVCVPVCRAFTNPLVISSKTVASITSAPFLGGDRRLIAGPVAILQGMHPLQTLDDELGLQAVIEFTLVKGRQLRRLHHLDIVERRRLLIEDLEALLHPDQRGDGPDEHIDMLERILKRLDQRIDPRCIRPRLPDQRL